MHPPEKDIRPDVFVAVPSYNHAPFVERCLRSIISQTLSPKKLLVIDDGSTDGSPAIIENVLNDCPFDCELITRENRGLCSTLNEAIALAGGEYFAYLGSDDVWLSGFLAEQTALLDRRPAAVLAFAHAYLIDEEGSVIGTTKEWTDFADGDLQPLLLSGTIFSSPGVLYRRSALVKHRWNEDALLEDYEMYLRLTGEGEFARNPKILCAWRQHGVNASTNLPVMFPEMITAQDRVAPQLGISRDDLDRSQRKMKFEAAENFVRYGFRREAARLFVENIRGATSMSQVLGTAFRLAVPQSLFQWNRRRKRRNAAARFGKLDDVIKKLSSR
jgi:alpha-1,3-rhamnosyltransferase